MTVGEYLSGMEKAQTAAELEAAIQADHTHPFHGRVWSKICKVRIAAGVRICQAHSNGRFVPTLGPRHKLECCGEQYRVGYGQNSTGIRYCWTYARFWAVEVLHRNGLSIRAAHQIWDEWRDYPHRCLSTVEKALAGEIPDPTPGVMIPHERTDYGSPVNITVEENDACTWDRRATRPCDCGGTLFNWGSGYSDGFTFINWHCNACPDVFSEYMIHQAPQILRQLPGTPIKPPKDGERA